MAMNTGMRRSLRHRLRMRDGDLCHYCEALMEVPEGRKHNPLMMTLEHVVPQSHGGPDDVNNMVLACHGCNNARGNDLDFCWCKQCANILNTFYNKRFYALIKANKPRVFLHAGQWRCKVIKETRTFNSWHDAMNYANGAKSNV